MLAACNTDVHQLHVRVVFGRHQYAGERVTVNKTNAAASAFASWHTDEAIAARDEVVDDSCIAVFIRLPLSDGQQIQAIIADVYTYITREIECRWSQAVSNARLNWR